MESHPFFETKKEEQWDAETILTTYSTLDNHPKMIRVQRRPKADQIHLDTRTGLPVGVALPSSAPPPRMPEPFDPSAALAEDEDEDEGPGVNLGVARDCSLRGEEKRQRKQAIKEEKRARRQQKKSTKQAFASERVKQLDTAKRTAQVAATNLSAQQTV